MSFIRTLSPNLHAGFLASTLYNTHLKADIFSKKVFPAIRNNRLDLYHKGGKLFKFDKSGYQTHIKYASVIPKKSRDYLNDKELGNYILATDFASNYDRIKENCANYSRIEAQGVSSLYHKYSYLTGLNKVVLDIEIALEAEDEDRNTDRIDILIYDVLNRKLQFVEAKHYSNKEIWSETTPKVIGQIAKYEGQVKSKKKEIIDAYCNYIDVVNTLFGLKLPYPLDINEKVKLLIFGFDDDQKKGRLATRIIKNSVFAGIDIYAKGDIKSIQISSI